MAAPKGNTNATKSKPWSRALERATAQDPDTMRKIAEKLLAMAADGDIAAIRELGDRLDGKAKQQIEATGEGGGPLTVQILRLSADNPDPA